MLEDADSARLVPLVGCRAACVEPTLKLQRCLGSDDGEFKCCETPVFGPRMIHANTPLFNLNEVSLSVQERAHSYYADIE